jgi:WD40 repeat protein
MADNSNDDEKKALQDEDEIPEVYSVGNAGGKPTFSRRSFLELAALAVGTTALSGGYATLAHGAKTHPRPALAHKDPVTTLSLNATGKLLASGDKKGTLKLWQLPEGVLLHSWSGYRKPVTGLAFPNINDTLWSLDSYGNLKRWHLPNGKHFSDAKKFRSTKTFAVPGKGNWYAVPANPIGIELRSQTTGEKLRAIEGLDDSVTVMAASADGRLMLAGGKHGNLGLWTESGNIHVQTVKAGPAAVSALTVDPNGTLALSAHADGRLRTWRLPELREEATYESNLGKLFSIAIRPQLDIFAVGSKKSEIGLWKLAVSGGKPKMLKGHTAAVRATTITSDGSLLISGSEDKTIRLWSLPDGKYLRNLVDLKNNYKNVEGMSYKGTDIYGRTVTYTLPCGSPIPPGAICTCNCVPGTMKFPRNHSQRYNSRGVCTCNLICTCNKVCTCQGVGGGRYISYWYPN